MWGDVSLKMARREEGKYQFRFPHPSSPKHRENFIFSAPPAVEKQYAAGSKVCSIHLIRPPLARIKKDLFLEGKSGAEGK